MPENTEARQIFTFEEAGERLLELAKDHGEDSEPDHEVGDLQVFFRTAWKLMNPRQRAQFLRDEAVAAALEGCAHEPTVFDADELDEEEVVAAHEFYGLDTSFQYTDEQVLDMVNAYRLDPARDTPSQNEGPRHVG